VRQLTADLCRVIAMGHDEDLARRHEAAETMDRLLQERETAVIRSSCFGKRRRLRGQKRVPVPPAITTANRSARRGTSTPRRTRIGFV